MNELFENFIENDMDLLEATEIMNVLNEEYIEEGLFKKDINEIKINDIINKIDKSNYDKYGNIIINNNSYIYSFAGSIIRSNPKVTIKRNMIEKSRKLLNSNAKFIDEYGVTDIEDLYRLGLNKSKLLLLLKKYRNQTAIDDVIGYGEDLTSDHELKELVGKTLSFVIYDNPIHSYVLYSEEDKICYIVNFEYGMSEGPLKVTIDELLNASKIAYTDLNTIINEYDKK